MSDGVEVERLDNVAIVTFTKAKVNALSTDLLLEIKSVFVQLHDDLPGAVVLQGGNGVFAGGADITEMDTPEQGHEIAHSFREALDAIETFPRVVIAAISRYALGGGLELALACDFRAATEGATLGFPEVTLGIMPGGGATQRLPRLIGASQAKGLLLSGESISSDEALVIGLLDVIVEDPEDLLPSALEMAEQFASGAVVAHGFIKKSIKEGADKPLNDALQIEAKAFSEVFATEDAKEGLRSFREDGPGKAQFTGK